MFFNFKTANSEIFIKAKINNQIITNIDVKDEKNYLLALNPRLKNLSNEEINRYALDSLINDKPLNPGSYRGRKNTSPEKKQNVNGGNHA